MSTVATDPEVFFNDKDLFIIIIVLAAMVCILVLAVIVICYKLMKVTKRVKKSKPVEKGRIEKPAPVETGGRDNPRYSDGSKLRPHPVVYSRSVVDSRNLGLNPSRNVDSRNLGLNPSRNVVDSRNVVGSRNVADSRNVVVLPMPRAWYPPRDGPTIPSEDYCI